MILIGWFIFVLVFKLPSRLSFVLSLLTLPIMSLLFLIDKYGFGFRVLVHAYGFLLIGLVTYLFELRNAKN